MKFYDPRWTTTEFQKCGAPEILNTLADGAYVTDTERRILFWNKSATRITGWPAAEVVGHSCKDNILVHVDKDGHELCGREFCPLHRSMVTGQPSDSAVLVFANTKDGKRVPVEVTVAPIRDNKGRVVGGIELFRDLTVGAQDMLRARLIQETELRCPAKTDLRVAFDVRYTPIDIVGGDFYRVESTDGDHYTAMVADVIGHGVAAALYTMQLRLLWEEGRALLNSPAAFMDLVNTRLSMLVQETGFLATGVCVNFNAATGAIRATSAGHPPPLLLRANGQVDRLTHRGAAFGLFPAEHYDEAVAQLEHGDALLLYTDGAVEIRNAGDQELGLDGLVDMIRTEADGHPLSAISLEKIEERLLRFSNQIHLPDDLTFLKIVRNV